MSADKITSIKRNDKPPKRKIRLSWILSILLLLIVVLAFGLSPLAGAFGSNSSDIVFGYYNNEPISFAYGNYFFNQRESIAQSWDTSSSDTNYEYQIYQIWKQAYDNTVMHTVLLQEAESSEMLITEDAIDRYLLESGPYIRDGQFDAELYNSVSDTMRENIREDLNDSLLVQTLQNDLFGTYVSPNEIEFIDAMSSQQKGFDYILYSLDQYPDDLTVAYGQSNVIEFTSIETSIITLSGENKQEAEAVYNKIINGEILFEDAARTYSLDSYSENGGDIGEVYFFAMRENFNSEEDLHKVFSLGENEVSELFETPYGFNIYRVDRTSELPDFENAEMVSLIKDYLISRERGKVEDYILGTISDLSFDNTADFNLYAEQNGLTVNSAAPTPVNYGSSLFISSLNYNDEALYLAQLEADETSIGTLFQTELNNLSEPIVIDSGIILAYCTEESTAEPNIETLQMLYPFMAPQIQQQDLTTMVFSSDNFEDNFLTTFFEVILSDS